MKHIVTNVPRIILSFAINRNYFFIEEECTFQIYFQEIFYTPVILCSCLTHIKAYRVAVQWGTVWIDYE